MPGNPHPIFCRRNRSRNCIPSLLFLPFTESHGPTALPMGGRRRMNEWCSETDPPTHRPRPPLCVYPYRQRMYAKSGNIPFPKGSMPVRRPSEHTVAAAWWGYVVVLYSIYARLVALLSTRTWRGKKRGEELVHGYPLNAWGGRGRGKGTSPPSVLALQWANI